MTKSLIDLYDLAEHQGIEVYSIDTRKAESISILSDGECAIGINPFMLESAADEKVKLAHEIGHCETGAFYNEYSRFSLRSKCEHRANVWAIKKPIPKDELIPAYKKGCTDPWSLAEYFEVTEDFMRKALEYYSA